VAILKKVRGEQHPQYARSPNDRVLPYESVGEYAKVAPLLQQALIVVEKE